MRASVGDRSRKTIVIIAVCVALVIFFLLSAGKNTHPVSHERQVAPSTYVPTSVNSGLLPYPSWSPHYERCDIKGPFPAYRDPSWNFFSQAGQDLFLEQMIFPDLYNGTFFEAGLFDGVTGSNAKFFELFKGWKGVCAEPNFEKYTKAISRRSCFAYHAAVCQKPGWRKFTVMSAPREQESGFWDGMEPFKIKILTDAIARGEATATDIMMKCIPFTDMLRSAGFHHLDLVSLDIEGGEMNVLKGLRWEDMDVDVFVIECSNFGSQEMIELMDTHNYMLAASVGWDHIFVKRGTRRACIVESMNFHVDGCRGDYYYDAVLGQCNAGNKRG
eukprot:TRINITY_DN11038_c0_g1_i1.p1 TRINITY_DN11038_c0_g1~~TRINITY_DN11038_c0_g1_i1.p1  ORF type:complete len:351 (-),score=64.68 TRINITY_DN11038_c0_g1_i1:117-1106(-)